MLPLVRSVWDEPRPPNPPVRVWRDWALVGLLVPIALLEGVLRPDLPWRVVSVAVTIGLIPTLLWRRSRPLLVVAIVFGTTSLAPLLTGGDSAETYTMGYLLIVVYALVRWGSGREAVIGLTIMLVAVCLSIVFDRLAPADAVAAFAVVFSAVTLGGAFRYRARARMRELDQVKLLEREQLARDLHDTVAHHVSAMAIRAQAGIAISASRPNAATEALHVIEAEASRALAEMRAMVRVLRRDQPADLAPGRRVTDLRQLADQGTSGLSVDVDISGDLGDLPPSVEAAIYRLAQEAVTNARRHARHATRVEVQVTADDTSVHLRVSDDGDTGSIRPPGPPGYGLIGMVERADLLGGTCEAGPDPDRGWTVTAALPRSGAAE
ncbi:sensor histidine kinase [Streptosporangium oxazolinicum]|uniref:sensor histidine kinase n=1 Tax=Streptosporangium oxazolinicum TaxID=909287 RepID=UPI0031EC54F9